MQPDPAHVVKSMNEQHYPTSSSSTKGYNSVPNASIDRQAIQNASSNSQNLDPDEIFAQHTVPEVKSILYKLKSDVDAKQEELRLMVGERYRDLLEASTSIISMSASSKRVVTTLDKIKETIAIDDMSGTRNSHSKPNEDAMLRALQSLASHLKLLLDTPEHLWRFIERRRYLHSAWLFLLARVVHRTLTKESEDDGLEWVSFGIHAEEKFPLVQRQWETVSQFRSQITHKATLALREQKINSKDLCDCLLALHLLDSLPLPDALDLFLKQRSRALTSSFEAVEPSSNKATSTTNTRSGKEELRLVRESLLSVLSTVAVTVNVGQQTFGVVQGNSSLIERIIRHSQGDLSHSTASFPEELRITTESLLSSLPNSNHFISLSSDIKSFKPFVDFDSSASVLDEALLNEKLRLWFDSSLAKLGSIATSWLSRLGSVREIWETRTSIQNWLTRSSLLDSSNINTVSQFMDELCAARTEAIWRLALHNLLSTFTEHLQEELKEIQGGTSNDIDTEASHFLLSAPPISSMTQATLGASLAQNSFQRFKRGIKQRLDGISPSLDGLISQLESSAKNLQTDLQHAFSGDGTRHRDLKEKYITDVEEVAQKLFSLLEVLLRDDITKIVNPIPRLVFLSRLLSKLMSSSVLSILDCSDDFVSRCRDRAGHIYEKSIDTSASEISKTTSEVFIKGVTASKYARTNMPSAPSPYIMVALINLIQAIENHGCFADHARRSRIAKTYLRSFSATVLIALKARNETLSAQSIWDLKFLKAICNSWGSEFSDYSVELDDVIDTKNGGDTEIPNARLENDILRYKNQVDLLLTTILAPPEALPSDLSLSKSLDKQGKTKAKGGASMPDHEPHMPLDLVKPSARFGSLWVGTTKGQ